ncbi:hypothetical protein DCS_02662 [Drechmeria coniospora]|uniref:Fe2OG dioxygenase domain-containing protein n=1 Tax=Drechmeria coniospora TaxID=98403 RepID=A0A151GWR6_DRECN|nr:hypothetical protein DCS_02662 [Drechmeria coniospora]KYK61520.1 hypothetical protein DCS_02662 [Drechmeria coniospora]
MTAKSSHALYKLMYSFVRVLPWSSLFVPRPPSVINGQTPPALPPHRLQLSANTTQRANPRRQRAMAAAAVAEIPLIDLAGNEIDVSRKLVAAAEDHGFIYIRNVGADITPASVDEAFSLSKMLFESPVEEKQKCSIQQNNRGWSSMHSETLDPKHQRVGDFFSRVHPVAIDSSSSGSVLRFLRYPAPESVSHDADDVRAGAHSDYGSITLLFRLKGQAGLEILKKDNSWAPVPVCPPGTDKDPSPPILVNIGDLLSYWTNGLFRSTVHRVVFPTAGEKVAVGESNSGPRYSIAYFCHPVGSARLEPVPSERVKNYIPVDDTPDVNPYAERKVMTADAHLLMRLKESYGTLYDDKQEESSQ